MALVVTISVGFTSVHADSTSDKAKIQQIKTQSDNLEIKVEIMDSQIQAIMSKIDGNENDITKTQKNIKQAQINIAKSEANIKAEQILFDKRMRVMYMSGSSSYVDIILGSKNIGDFISKLEDIKTIVNFDQNVISDFRTKEEAINLKKIALDKENAKLLSLRIDNKNKLAILTKQELDEAVMVAQLNAQENQYGTKLLADQTAEARQAIESRQAAVAASQVALEKIRNAASRSKSSTPIFKRANSSSTNPVPSSVTSRGGTTFSSNSVLAYASNFLGVPYVWGGTSPSGFDCSGFTQYVFAHFGINLPRVSEDQQNVGTMVSRANLQPGDLVFFGTPAHHVGIYVGDGNMINAPHTGAVIRIQTLNSDFTYGRRVN